MFLIHSIFLIRLFSWLARFREDGIIILIGAVVGFLSGLLGKGGSAITTPALQIFAQVNPFAALASPLPAALPTTLSASFAYSKNNLINRKVVIFSILIGIPATIIGSYFSDWLGGSILMILTAIFVLALGISFLFFSSFSETVVAAIVVPTWKISIVAISVGFLSGLLANSGGVLFGPLFIRFLKLPTKQALACSLLVAAGLAVPGTIVHWYLGHINWTIVLWLSISSIPFSYIGARVALQMKNDILEKIFGVMLVAFGAFDLWYSFLHR
ncbi:sulfite exporter TauE/SafE family protein [Ginsengibacter hankyongi]|uniref:Probable membrane transporter protein n=1 Tax=Ginsengibacter hankyongi TaxID=2607284 RepID=A0A5J5IGX1_9BACT|nr:sulfite exporter TauE/SafE family protein [Ginsengibacter hankyongi]KAA9039425.1 sulfite exporter TauE/SafE family protein [Ginsengibacter hankyongi]